MQHGGLGHLTPRMEAPAFHAMPDGRRIAFRHHAGRGPGAGVPARLHVATWPAARRPRCSTGRRRSGRECLLLDYSGCGAVDGDFADGTLSRWRDEVLALIEAQVAATGRAGRIVDGRLADAAGRARRWASALPRWSASPPRRTSPNGADRTTTRRGWQRARRCSMPIPTAPSRPRCIPASGPTGRRNRRLGRRDRARLPGAADPRACDDADVPWEVSPAPGGGAAFARRSADAGQGRRPPAVRATRTSPCCCAPSAPI